MHRATFAMRPTVLAASLAALLGTAPCAAWAQAPATPATASAHRYDIPAQALGSTLTRIATEGGQPVSVDSALVRGIGAPPVRGSFTPEQAVQAALAGSGLAVARTGSGALTVVQRAPAPPAAPAPPPAPPSGASLGEVRVTAEASRDGAGTEGSGSYAGHAVTLGKTVQSVKDIPQSITVLTRQLIDDQQITTMSELMAQAPGVVVTKGDTGYQNFYARGFRIDNYQIDGAGVSYDASFRPDFDLALYDRVEVLRGAEGLFSASGNPSGSVNLVRKRPTRSWQGSATLSTGSWSSHRADIDLGGPVAFDGKVRARMVAALQDRAFFYAPADEKKSILYGVLETDLGPSTLLTAGLSYQREEGTVWYNGLPRYTDGTDLHVDRRRAFTTDWSRRERSIKELFASLEHAVGADWRLKLQASRQQFDENNLYFLLQGPIDIAGRTFSQGSASYGDTGNHADAVDLSSESHFRLWGRRHQLVVGADWRSSKAHQEGYYTSLSTYSGTVGLDSFHGGSFARPDILGPRSFYPGYGATQKGLYGKLQLQATDALRVIAGGRYGSYAYSSPFYLYNEAGALTRQSQTLYRESGVFTPYAGLVYDINDTWAAYASLTDIYKPQSNYQQGPPETSAPLDPIRGRNAEVGIKGSLLDGALQASLALYRVERTGEAVADARYLSATGEFGSSCCYLAQGKIVSQGIDTELSGQLARGWQVFAGYTYNQNRNRQTQTVAHAATPRHVVKLWTTYALPEQWSAWTVGAGVSLQSRQANMGSDWVYKADGSGWVYQPFHVRQGGYALWNLSAQYRIGPDWTLALNVKNLFDKVYYQTLGTTRAGNWYGEPRSVALTLRARF